MMLITKEVLLMIAPNLARDRAKVLADAMNEVLPQYGIVSHDEFEEYLANVLHETKFFRIRVESMNYTSASRIVEIWPSRFNLTGTNGRLNANLFVRQPVKLANAVYNGRMGNRMNTNDGFDFRGGGDPQLTGRDAYTLFAAHCNRKWNTSLTAFNWAERVRSNDYWSVVAGGWFFEWKNLGPLTRMNDINGVRRRWNGGKIGLNDTLRCLEIVKKYLPLVNVKTSPVVIRTSSGSGVRLRAGQGTNFSIITTIPNGSAVSVISRGAQWSQVRFNNQHGWVASEFLS